MARRNVFRDLGVTKEEIKDLYVRQNKTDAEIAALRGVTDVAISYFRRRNGIATRSQVERLTFHRSGPLFSAITPVELANVYASTGLRGVAKLYGVSKPTVAAKCRAFGIGMLSKTERSTSLDELTQDQKDTIIGSLLGDGHLLEHGVFKLTHYQEQVQYLLHTHKILAPHVLPLFYEEKEMDNGRQTFAFGYRTVQHEWMKTLRNVFYPKGEKVFPEDVLNALSPRSLAYWYFDDGHFDGLPSIALGKIPYEMAQMVANSVSTRFHVQTYIKASDETCLILGIRGGSSDVFFELIRDYTPSDMLYKFPAKHWPKGMTAVVPTRTVDPYLLPSGLVREAKTWPDLLSEDDKNATVEAFAQFWESHGFPYHVPRPEELTALIHVDLAQVIQDGRVKARQVGQGICQGVCSHIWSAHSYGGDSPYAIFTDRLKLREVIKFCLNFGGIPNASRLRGALRYWKRSGVYNFRPSAAKVLTDMYCPSGGTVLDPCAGYGGRLLGVLLSKASPSYVGYDPATDTINNLHKLHHWVCSYLPQLADKATLHHQPAEEAAFPQSVDMVITSPPYWKREVYSDEPTQSAAKFPTYDGWLEGFWKPVIAKSVDALKPGGWLVLNVDDFSVGGRDYPLIEDTVRVVVALGLGAPTRMVYDLPGTEESSNEVVLTWSKGQGLKPQNDKPSDLNLPSCKVCGKVLAMDLFTDGVCAACAIPLGYTVKCEECQVAFLARRKDQRFHSEACYARYKRRLEREVNPPTGIRTFTCSGCSKEWHTKEHGNFKLCPGCKEKADLGPRTKACEYRHCRAPFVDTSPKNSMSYCCTEHRRREKLFRAGVAKDESYFREPTRLLPKCLDCKERWKPEEGEVNIRCRACRYLKRQKFCQKCGDSYRDGSDNNTRRYCFGCKPE